jgi:hypothetical protein
VPYREATEPFDFDAETTQLAETAIHVAPATVGTLPTFRTARQITTWLNTLRNLHHDNNPATSVGALPA